MTKPISIKSLKAVMSEKDIDLSTKVNDEEGEDATTTKNLVLLVRSDLQSRENDIFIDTGCLGSHVFNYVDSCHQHHSNEYS